MRYEPATERTHMSQRYSLSEAIECLRNTLSAIDRRAVLILEDKQWVNVFCVVRLCHESVEVVSSQWREHENRFGEADTAGFKIVTEVRPFENWNTVVAQFESGTLSISGFEARLRQGIKITELRSYISRYPQLIRSIYQPTFPALEFSTGGESMRILLDESLHRELSAQGFASPVEAVNAVCEANISSGHSIEQGVFIHLPVLATLSKFAIADHKAVGIEVRFHETLAEIRAELALFSTDSDGRDVLLRRQPLQLNETEEAWPFKRFKTAATLSGDEDSAEARLIVNGLGLIEENRKRIHEDSLQRATPSRSSNADSRSDWLSQLGPASGEPTSLNINWTLLHPLIRNVAEGRFSSRHFADSVEAALKEVNTRVKEQVRSHTNEERDGAGLMHFAFAPKNPILLLGDLSTETGKSMQQGYMELFAGAMTGVRNPKAHQNVEIEPERAIHFLFLASLLMQKLDEAEVVPLDKYLSNRPQRPADKGQASPRREHSSGAPREPRLVCLPFEVGKHYDSFARMFHLMLLPVRNEVTTDQATIRNLSARIEFHQLGTQKIVRVHHGVWHRMSRRAIDLTMRDTISLVFLARSSGRPSDTFFAMNDTREHDVPLNDSYDEFPLDGTAYDVKVFLVGERFQRELLFNIILLQDSLQIKGEGITCHFQVRSGEKGEQLERTYSDPM